jgi:hypothetical protein
MAPRYRQSRHGFTSVAVQGPVQPGKKAKRIVIATKHAGVANLRDQKTGERRLVNVERYPSVKRYQTKDMRQGMTKLLEQVNEMVRAHGIHMTDAGAEILYNALLPTFRKSSVYCPVSVDGSHGGAPGALRGTGAMEIIQRSRGGVKGQSTIEMSYGRTGRVWYAAFVHEISSYAHESPTSYKFLERAIKEDMKLLPKRIAEEAQKAAGQAATK